MSPKSLLQWNVRSVLLVTGVWTALVLMSWGNSMIGAQQFDRDFDAAGSLLFIAGDWYTCAVFTPLFVWMARHWPIDSATWQRRVPAWLLVTAAIIPLKYALQQLYMIVVLPSWEMAPLGSRIITRFIPESIAFWAMIAVILSVEYYERWSERERQALLLGRQLAEARLEALSAQLQPHFLFNTLQGISTLLYRDIDNADRMLGRLGELLRRTLQQGDAPEVPLAEELATLEHYIAIQRIRFEDRLTVNVHADGLGSALVPHFILQPLVENAIEHGIARRAGPGVIDVTARADQGTLLLSVRDDGGATTAPPRASRGIGLANTRARLQALHGDDASLVLTRGGAGGCTVTIRLPLRRVEVAA